MTYRVICTFHPDVAVFPYPRKGAWRVIACSPRATTDRVAVTYPVLTLTNLRPQLLIVSSVRRRQPGSWVSPRKILAEWFAARGEVRRILNKMREEAREHEAGERAYEAYCARAACER